MLLATILLPWALWGDPFTRWVTDLVQTQSGRWLTAAVFAGLLAVDVFLPIPSSFVAVGAGMALGGVLGAATTALGLTVGCVAGYLAGAYLGRPGVKLLIKPMELAALDRFALRYADGVVLLFRAVPVLAEASVLFAGATRTPFVRFLLLATLANVLIGGVYGAAGQLAAESGSYSLALFVACAIPFAGIVLSRKRP